MTGPHQRSRSQWLHYAPKPAEYALQEACAQLRVYAHEPGSCCAWAPAWTSRFDTPRDPASQLLGFSARGTGTHTQSMSGHQQDPTLAFDWPKSNISCRPGQPCRPPAPCRETLAAGGALSAWEKRADLEQDCCASAWRSGRALRRGSCLLELPSKTQVLQTLGATCARRRWGGCAGL